MPLDCCVSFATTGKRWSAKIPLDDMGVMPKFRKYSGVFTSLLVCLVLLSCRLPSKSGVKMLGGKEDMTSYPATVAVGIYTGNKLFLELCTGTFIRDDLLLTAAHCAVDPGGAVTSIGFAPDYASLGGGGKVQATGWTPHPGYVSKSAGGIALTSDIMIVRFPKGTYTGAIPTIGKSPPTVGEAITMVGYGATKVDPNNQNAYDNMGPRKVGQNTVAQLLAENEGQAITWNRLAEGGGAAEPAGALQGDSGGPVYNSKGELVGLLRAQGINSDASGKKIQTTFAVNLNFSSIASFLQNQINTASDGAVLPNASLGKVGGYTCEEQAKWGKCSESWMHPVCDGVCSPGKPADTSGATAGLEVGGYTCEQQAKWGKCSESWMHPVCDSVCSGK